MSGRDCPTLIDTHCHLDFPEYDADRDEVIRRAADNGVRTMITVGATLERSRRCVELAGQYADVFATVGCHPHDARECDQAALAELAALAGRPKVVAVGEIGLDYYRTLSPAEEQKRVFGELLGLAARRDLAVVVHSRQAPEDTLAMLREYAPRRAIVHCFSGDQAFLRSCLDLGLFVSFTGNITYKRSQELREIVRLVPADRFCLETDAPYLSPEGHRGTRNEPGMVRLLAEEVARIRGASVGEVAECTTRNARSFFRLG